MAEIRLQNLAHSYSAQPSGPDDYAIRAMAEDIAHRKEMDPWD